MSRLYGEAIQLCYLVEDLAASLDYWTRSLGIGPFFVLPPREFVWLEHRGRPCADKRINAGLALGYSGDMQIELIVPGPAPSVYRDFQARGHRGLHHLGFASYDYDRQRAAAVAEGMHVAMEGASALARFAYLEGDADAPGTVVELIEMNPGIETVFARIKAASVGWDGSDPVRAL